MGRRKVTWQGSDESTWQNEKDVALCMVERHDGNARGRGPPPPLPVAFQWTLEYHHSINPHECFLFSLPAGGPIIRIIASAPGSLNTKLPERHYLGLYQREWQHYGDWISSLVLFPTIELMEEERE